MSFIEQMGARLAGKRLFYKGLINARRENDDRPPPDGSFSEVEGDGSSGPLCIMETAT